MKYRYLFYNNKYYLRITHRGVYKYLPFVFNGKPIYKKLNYEQVAAVSKDEILVKELMLSCNSLEEFVSKYSVSTDKIHALIKKKIESLKKQEKFSTADLYEELLIRVPDITPEEMVRKIPELTAPHMRCLKYILGTRDIKFPIKIPTQKSIKMPISWDDIEKIKDYSTEHQVKKLHIDQMSSR